MAGGRSGEVPGHRRRPDRRPGAAGRHRVDDGRQRRRVSSLPGPDRHRGEPGALRGGDGPDPRSGAGAGARRLRHRSRRRADPAAHAARAEPRERLRAHAGRAGEDCHEVPLGRRAGVQEARGDGGAREDGDPGRGVPRGRAPQGRRRRPGHGDLRRGRCPEPAVLQVHPHPQRLREDPGRQHDALPAGGRRGLARARRAPRGKAGA
jgi:hypothetical protein